MFECDVDRDEGSVKLKRRAFLLTSVSAVAGLAVWSMRKPRLAEATGSKEAAARASMPAPI